jgi:hypothetical protein
MAYEKPLTYQMGVLRHPIRIFWTSKKMVYSTTTLTIEPFILIRSTFENRDYSHVDTFSAYIGRINHSINTQFNQIDLIR